VSAADSFQLGSRTIGRVGFGAMQLPGRGVWGPPADRERAIEVLRRARELGVNHIDTAQYYGPDVANELIVSALFPYESELCIVTKVGAVRDERGGWISAMRPEQLRAGVEENLRSLRLEQMHMVNLRMTEPGDEAEAVALEDSLGALMALRDEGKLELIGVSNVSLAQLEQARAMTSIAGVQNSYSVFDRSRAEVFDACLAGGLAFAAFFPLGSAFGDGPARLAEDVAIGAVAARHGATRSQIALAWLLRLAPNVLLIPGTSSQQHLEENVAVAAIELDDEDVAKLDAIAA
jgi:aryl-alcohol dehydrogenase-like predicted oxidoreductase